MAGAVTVPAGDNSGVDLGRASVTYWFAPGVHTLGSGEFAQVIPGSGSAYIGAPGAILDGRHVNDYAFGGGSANVTISYLTIQDFGQPGGNQDQGVVNHDSATSWTIGHSTITDNAGAGVMLGSGDVLLADCLKDNEQYGFNAYSPAGPTGLVLSGNEITGNDTFDYEAKHPGCGCSGGGKFWDVNTADVTGNWVTGNHSVGLWADTNNRGFRITGNYIADNYGNGIIYEISYNAEIANNTFIRNGIGAGPTNPGFPTAAVYISESGADRRVNTRYKTSLSIIDNTFQDNWSGVKIGPSCTAANGCGFVGIFSQYGTFPSWSPYQGAVVEQHITHSQNNYFRANFYLGPWQVMAGEQGTTVSWSQWMSASFSQDLYSVERGWYPAEPRVKPLGRGISRSGAGLRLQGRRTPSRGRA